MMVWLNPAALWALALVLGPVLVHLRSRRAPRVVFPSLRFVRPSAVTATRLRLPSDWLLLLVRCAIVATAACAIAQPLVITASRLASWNSRTARVALVDSTDSMQISGAVAEADAVVEAELRDAFVARRIDARDLPLGLAAAVAWLATSPPARQEIVLISDFHSGSFAASNLASVPPHVGIRTISVGASPDSRRVDGPSLIGAAGVPARQTVVELTSTATHASISTTNGDAATGLAVLGPPGRHDDVLRLLRAVAAAGAPAPSPAEPIVVRFGDSEGSEGVGSGRFERWMLRTILRLGADTDAVQSARSITASPALSRATSGIVVMRDARGQVLVHASTRGDALVLETSADVASYFAAALLRATLGARHGSVEQPEQEIRRIDRAELAALNRPASDVPAQGWRQAEVSDARWCWFAALVLMAAEQWLRRSRPPVELERRDVAA